MQTPCQGRHYFLGETYLGVRTDRVIATMEPEEDADHSDLPTRQWEDPDLADIIRYLETGILPQDEGQARTLVLSSLQYVLEDETSSTKWNQIVH